MKMWVSICGVETAHCGQICIIYRDLLERNRVGTWKKEEEEAGNAFDWDDLGMCILHVCKGLDLDDS